MGIRVHKVIGYGLVDVACNKNQIDDDRINADSPLLDWETDITAADYLRWLIVNNMAASCQQTYTYLTNGKKYKKPVKDLLDNIYLRDWCHHNNEHGLANVIALTIPGLPWSRYDNDIDFAVETFPEYNNQSQTEWFKILDRGPYPFDNLFIQPDKIPVGSSAMCRITPGVPDDIKALVKFAELFKNQDDWKLLQPLLYVYWS